MTVALDVSELRALGFRLQAASGTIGALTAAAVRKTAFDIEADAKALAPVDTGNLKNSITTTLTGDGRTGSMSAEIGPTAEYGVFQEYGTSTQPGKAYMGPAFDRRAPGLDAAIGQILDGLI
ncbi:HK97-gp10 family putative phage morphogenesis protein [Nocardioides sp. InS609-2]|uniref:HK97-gp10 family putative phage morphogenesis protein n=1 Tax=Nocardioides sp. InS609-2 TaxID=2760705 RepID=UPI0020BDCE78|nr:HK97-gp10 family putative phage morphogenesis protein [Nocardioides sp. InS609-2]